MSSKTDSWILPVLIAHKLETVFPYKRFCDHLTFIHFICSNRYSALSWFNPRGWTISRLHRWRHICLQLRFWFKTWNLAEIKPHASFWLFSGQQRWRNLIFSVACSDRSHQFCLQWNLSLTFSAGFLLVDLSETVYLDCIFQWQV